MEAAYWEKTYTTEPYYESGYPYDDYSPAYCTGYLGRSQFTGRTYESCGSKSRGGESHPPAFDQARRYCL